MYLYHLELESKGSCMMFYLACELFNQAFVVKIILAQTSLLSLRVSGRKSCLAKSDSVIWLSGFSKEI